MNYPFSNEYDDPVLTGEGAFGSVYRVREKETGKFYAMKVTSNEKLWEREKQFLALADHPLFPKMKDAGSEDGVFYILMEYVWGESLDAVLDRRGGFAQPDAMKLALEVADGLAWLQQQDGTILFRDLKAANLILTPEGNLRLVDFGSACFLEEADGAMTGSRGYAAPEQLSEEGGQGTYSDVYAFGRLFHYILTGEDPAKEEPEPLRTYDPSFSAALELLIEDCIRPVGEERLPDMYCVLERMISIASNTPRGFKKLEKEAARKLAQRGSAGSGIVYEKNINA